MAGNGNFYTPQYGAVSHNQAYSFQQPVQHVYYTGISQVQYGGYGEPAATNTEMPSQYISLTGSAPEASAYSYQPTGIGSYASNSGYVEHTNTNILNRSNFPLTVTDYTNSDQTSYTAQPFNYGQKNITVNKYQKSSGGVGGWQNKRLQFNRFGQKKDRQIKTPQLQFCDICKISCAGPQTYLEHLEGKTHKKKELQTKSMASNQLNAHPATNNFGPSKGIKCELCDIMCSGTDSYAEHIKGLKHQKVLELHNKMGKPIPENTAVNFTKSFESSELGEKQPTPFFIGPKKQRNNTNDGFNEEQEDVQPVGEEYLDESLNSTGTTMTYYCKLCLCHISDPVAKDAHLKGKRHRLAYKTKVDKTLVVKSGSYGKRYGSRGRGGRSSGSGGGEDFSMRKQVEMLRREKEILEQRLTANKEVESLMSKDIKVPTYMTPSLLNDFMPRPLGPQRSDPRNDAYVVYKHQEIYPNEEDLQNVQNIVVDVEKALKIISDQFAELDTPKEVKSDNRILENKEECENKQIFEPNKPKQIMINLNEVRHIKGVMRTGPLAKGLLLHSDLNVDLLILCDEWPTRTLVKRVATELPNQLMVLNEGKYQVSIAIDASFILVDYIDDLHISCRVSLTSTAVKQDIAQPNDSLPRELCLQLLSSLRQTKWFENQAVPLKNCLLAIRVMKDLCIRIPTWHPITHWSLELLVERCLFSYHAPLSPSMAIRVILECLSSGFLLPGGLSIMDPCEKDQVDVFEHLQLQEREDITNCAQQALRLLALNQIHLLLGIDDIYSQKYQQKDVVNLQKQENEDLKTPSSNINKTESDNICKSFEAVCSKVDICKTAEPVSKKKPISNTAVKASNLSSQSVVTIENILKKPGPNQSEHTVLSSSVKQTVSSVSATKISAVTSSILPKSIIKTEDKPIVITTSKPAFIATVKSGLITASKPPITTGAKSVVTTTAKTAVNNVSKLAIVTMTYATTSTKLAVTTSVKPTLASALRPATNIKPITVAKPVVVTNLITKPGSVTTLPSKLVVTIAASKQSIVSSKSSVNNVVRPSIPNIIRPVNNTAITGASCKPPAVTAIRPGNSTNAIKVNQPLKPATSVVLSSNQSVKLVAGVKKSALATSYLEEPPTKKPKI